MNGLAELDECGILVLLGNLSSKFGACCVEHASNAFLDLACDLDLSIYLCDLDELGDIVLAYSYFFSGICGQAKSGPYEQDLATPKFQRAVC